MLILNGHILIPYRYIITRMKSEAECNYIYLDCKAEDYYMYRPVTGDL